jgi:(p)ppGpp synthase/HD superfamily hydrolase
MSTIEHEPLVNQALAYARKKFAGRRHKFSGDEYLKHPIRVAEQLQAMGYAPNVVASAVLHDAIEDTDAHFSNLSDAFGPTVAELISEITWDVDEMRSAGRKEYIVRKLNRISDRAFSIKLIDRLDNVRQLRHAPPEMARRYAAETYYILENLERDLSPAQEKVVDQISRAIAPYLSAPAQVE